MNVFKDGVGIATGNLSNHLDPLDKRVTSLEARQDKILNSLAAAHKSDVDAWNEISATNHLIGRVADNLKSNWKHTLALWIFMFVNFVTTTVAIIL